MTTETQEKKNNPRKKGGDNNNSTVSVSLTNASDANDVDSDSRADTKQNLPDEERASEINTANNNENNATVYFALGSVGDEFDDVIYYDIIWSTSNDNKEKAAEMRVIRVKIIEEDIDKITCD